METKEKVVLSISITAPNGEVNTTDDQILEALRKMLLPSQSQHLADGEQFITITGIEKG